MAVKQNAQDYSHKYPAAAIQRCFYVDDGLTGADSVEEAIDLKQQLQDLFAQGCFNWRSGIQAVQLCFNPFLQNTENLRKSLEFGTSITRTLGVKWDTKVDCFFQSIADQPTEDTITKRLLLSDVAKVYDMLGWFSPTIILMKVLLQRPRNWTRMGYQVPDTILHTWKQWRQEFPELLKVRIPRYYYQGLSTVTEVELHGFGDASEDVYAGVVYLRATDSSGYVWSQLRLRYILLRSCLFPDWNSVVQLSTPSYSNMPRR